MSPGAAYLRRLNAHTRMLERLMSEVDTLDEDDRDRLILAERAMNVRGPVLFVPSALKHMQRAAESDTRRIWAKYHTDAPKDLPDR